jgi:predicted 3-demethylubiquinone-9 3-methyltransferase (glyoxalase superfamily)/uncharacterized protein YndB with AHSA1/START domain
MPTNQKITPFLWFNNQAEEAVNLYTSIFSNSKIDKIKRIGEDAIMTIAFSIDGQEFVAFNGGPMFTFNPTISFYTVCETAEETDAVWQKLLEGGKVMMPLDKYPWSEKYGWLSDKYGISWQISQGDIAAVGQKVSPLLMFTDAEAGRAEEAINLYTSIFNNSHVIGIARYEEGEGDPAVGTIKHAQFSLDGNVFMVIDSSIMHGFAFNESTSFVLYCDTQEEVDYYWEKLTANGGEESMCGWCKDPFGVSWQVTPRPLLELLSDPNPERAQRAAGAMMQMRKIDIAKLHQAANDESKTVVTVQTTVHAPIEKVWQFWTSPEHITQWNNASDDWHTPRAENDLRVGGSFNTRMESKDGSMGFDFTGTYQEVVENKSIEYTIEDGRKVQIHFSPVDNGTFVMETFETESMNPVEMQRQGWQAIMDNFKKYAESIN